MRILHFLLDNLFFVLVGAVLLRAWMNSLRIRMTQQPGAFVMAITDWIVMPVRRALPRRWAQATSDWGSLLSAALLSMCYALLLHLLVSGFMSGMEPLSWALSLPVVALTFLLRTGLQLVMGLSLLYALISWVQPMSPLFGMLGRLLEPVLRPLRKLIPTLGGVDISVFVLLLVLQLLLLALA